GAITFSPFTEPGAPAPRVSSRTLLLGLLETHARSELESPILELLELYGLSRKEFDDLMRASMDEFQTKFDPSASKRISLKDFPPMSNNVISSLEAAESLTKRVPSPPPVVPVRFLFGGLLQFPRGGAYRTLNRILKDPEGLKKIADQYPSFL